MYCKKCGRQIADGVNFCPYCGAEQNINDTFHQYNNYEPAQESKTLAYLALIFGILGGILGLILGLVGLSTYRNPENRKLCKIGIGFFVFWVIVFILL